ncbi:Cytochrome P450 89A2 [Vitis vinifera]|uniref:Cytochrome P450 89A2 n=1 Tax=Vitis vinifera TaxID=29760 RepID=A0A438CEH8_VITVI|nr:Cytochrome P450 89A2 [Vitis vinifera]
MDHFQYAMFCLLVLMCFGDKLEEKQIQEIEMIQRKLLLAFRGLNRLNLWPRMGKILFRKRWEEWLNLRKDQEAILLPHIRARQRLSRKRKTNKKMIHLHLQRTMSCLDHGEPGEGPHIQARLFEEISGVVGEGEEEVKEEDLQKMPYLKAVVLEGLRRHPPGHFVLPHSVTRDRLNWNPTIWEDPMEFKPERFLNSNGDGDHADAGKEFDITGSREIKMMPFGAGRRICPGYGLAMLHLEYFVGNLVWNFEWKAVEGDEVDLSEKLEFTVVMKNPLQAHLSPRLK